MKYPKQAQNATLEAPASPAWSCQCIRCECEKLRHPHLPATQAEQWIEEQPPLWEPISQPTCHIDSRLVSYYIDRFGFALLNRATLEFIRPYAPLLEVAAGTGYWSHELQSAGITVAATDPNPRERWPLIPLWTEIETLTGRQAMARYPERNLLLCWPDMQDWSQEVVTEFRGEFLLYVGERETGCTGTTAMFRALEDGYDPVRTHRIPTFNGNNDRLQVYRRKENPARSRRARR